MESLLKNWDSVRIIRMALGIAISAYAFWSKEYILALPGALLMLQAILNLSCCARGNCHTGKENKQLYKDVIKEYKANGK